MSRPSVLAGLLQSGVGSSRNRNVSRFQPELMTLEDRLAPATYTNPTPISIPDSGAGSPYPSPIDVVGFVGTIGDVNVSLHGFEHTWPSDVGVLLVGPDGSDVYVMDGAGGSDSVSGLEFTFDDEAPGPIPGFGPLVSGTYQCADYFGDIPPGPAPPPSGNTLLSTFDGSDPNGTWNLWVFDAVGGDQGQFAGGWTLEIIPGNTAPSISDIPDQVIDEDSSTGVIAFTVDDAETPPGSLVVTRSSSNTTLVPTANIVLGGSGANREVTVTPAANQFGTVTITITVSDGSDSVSDTFEVTVNPVNDPPSISSISDLTIAESSTTGPIAFTVSDIDNPAGSLTVSGSSSNTTLVPDANIAFAGGGANRTVQVTPVAGMGGVATITITVSDGLETATETFVLTVNAIPTISDIGDQTINEDSSTGAIAFTIGDLETPAGSLTLTRGSSNTTLVPISSIVFGGSGANRTVNVTPTANLSGSSTITVTVTDGAGASRQDTFVVTVLPVNDPPQAVILNVPSNPLEGSTINLTGSQIDPDSSSWSYQWTVVASNGQVIPPDGGVNFSFIPTDNGTYTVTLLVTDNGSGATGPLQDTEVIGITVLNANPNPNPGGPYKVLAGSSVKVTGTATDPAGSRDTLTYTWDFDGDGVFGESGAAAQRGSEVGASPNFVANGFAGFTEYTVTLKVADEDGGSATKTALITVFPLSYAFDFNASTNINQSGFVGVRGNNLFNSASLFGWNSTVAEYDNNESTALLRDGHTGVDNTFSVRVMPGARYEVTFQFRDKNDRKFDILAEGALRANDVRVRNFNRRTDLVPRNYNFTVTTKFFVTSADGILDLRLRGELASAFVINSLTIVRK